MSRISSLFAVSLFALSSLTLPALAMDDGDDDLWNLCSAANQLCHATCDLGWGGAGFSASLRRELCHSDCDDSFRACVGPGDGDAIVREEPKSNRFSETLKRQSLPAITY